MYSQERLIEMSTLSNAIDKHFGVKGTPTRIEFDLALKEERLAIIQNVGNVPYLQKVANDLTEMYVRV